MSYENILVETRGAVGLITLNRPKALNALCDALVREMGAALDGFEADDAIGAIVITGSEQGLRRRRRHQGDAEPQLHRRLHRRLHHQGWERVTTCRKPVIAAVAGFALGGGCELAMMCDFIIAADTAKFGQPEIKLGIIPGAGGTQRLTRFVGKAKAMDMVLTGRMMDAAEAERSGLVSRVVPADKLVDEAVKMAAQIAALSRPSVLVAKEAVNRAFETTLAEGVRFERRLFHALFATRTRRKAWPRSSRSASRDFKNAVGGAALRG